MQPTPLMIRRRLLGLAMTAPLSATAWALGLDSLTNADAAAGVREALARGASVAVGRLGVPDGFLGHPEVKIPLPPSLARIESALRFAGMKDQADALVVSMNRAAEQAVPLAKPLLLNAIKTMTVSDAKHILTGGETAVTDFFATRTREPLTGRFLPIVKQQTDRVGLARQYNDLAGRAVQFGVLDTQDANIERYVTGKALDALYGVIGQEERSIRQDPVGAGSALLTKVFGALR